MSADSESASVKGGKRGLPWGLAGWIIFSLIVLSGIFSESTLTAYGFIMNFVVAALFTPVIVLAGSWIRSLFRDAPKENPDHGFQNSYWHTHYAVILLIGLLAAYLIIDNTLKFMNIESGGIAVILAIPSIILVPYGLIGSVYACYYDAKDLRLSKYDYFPLWGAWMIGHVILTPFIAAPLYLAQRYRKVGSPTVGEMRSVLRIW